ncbi:MAG TPA: ABC transporter ATP-binding protein [Kofleriaceae bacterium]|nr:ABC transporter ATP-binding protein [Kofleriaceae bacterium]
MNAGGALELARLGKTYRTPRGPAVIVEEVSLQVGEGELVSLLGHSGCGKSTVLSMIAGLIEPSAGEIRVGGKPVRGPGPDRGMVFQAPCLLPWLDVLDNVLLGVNQVVKGGVAARRARAEQALASVGLGDALTARPAALSAGMRQRVALARALALEPRVLLLDEPFGMLDSVTRAELQDMVLALGPARPTTILVTHDVDEALLLSDRIAVMTDGPAARIREVVEVPFGRERTRSEVSALGLGDKILGRDPS